MRVPGEKTGLDKADEKQFLEFVKVSFAKKRKTLVNNLRNISEPAATRATLASLGLALEARAEELSVKELVSVFVTMHP
jgi:16S rRNA A1518/A1519 N6-dimethyltransferase RsmA/KsgA/DIM1 with predicted DNA glycosylase/AP lyase activity